MIKLFGSIEKVHNCGYTYNDLKPSNIMFDNDANLILIDYGLCKPFKINETHIDEGSLAEKFEGNILFASPFQLQFMATSRRDDIYSLAYLLIYMLNGGKLPLYEKFLGNKAKGFHDYLGAIIDYKCKHATLGIMVELTPVLNCADDNTLKLRQYVTKMM